MADILGLLLAPLLTKPLAGELTSEGLEPTMVTLSFPIASAR
jgi:hypothetical protein